MCRLEEDVEAVMVDGSEYLHAGGIPRRRRSLDDTGNSADDVIQEDVTSFPVCRVSDQDNAWSPLSNDSSNVRAHMASQWPASVVMRRYVTDRFRISSDSTHH